MIHRLSKLSLVRTKNDQPTFRYLSRHHHQGEREGMSDVEMVTVCEQWNVQMTIEVWNAQLKH